MGEDLKRLEDRVSRLEAQVGAISLRQTTSRKPIELFDAVCSDCGKNCKIPFRPKHPNKPIYCKECWRKHKKNR